MKEEDKEEKLAEHKDEEKMKEEEDKEEKIKEEKKKEHYKMSEDLPSAQLLSEIQLLREQVQTLQSEKLAAERREAVGSLLREGKISPSEEEARQTKLSTSKRKVMRSSGLCFPSDPLIPSFL
jgi:hypothetical protein